MHPAARGLESLAFVIPVRIDTPDRLWNLGTVLRFLVQRLPGAEVLVVEQDGQSQLRDLLAGFPSVRHEFTENRGPFRKAEAVNLGALRCTRPYLCMYDTDILLAPEAIAQGLAALQRGWRLVLPFNRIFLDVAGSLRERLGSTLDLRGYERVRRLAALAHEPELTVRFVEGGIFMAQRETFLAEGGLNRRMVSYGWEDTEMHKRFVRLGYPILHLPGFNLVHLDHRRGADSRPNEHYDTNRAEFHKVLAMRRPELQRYVERELSLEPHARPERLMQVRRARRRHDPLGLRRLWAAWRLLQVQWQAHGTRHLVRRLVLR